MAEYALRIVVEKIDVSNQENVIQRNEITTVAIKNPKHIIDLGLRHAEQIDLIQKLQDHLLSEQSFYLASEIQSCEECDKALCRCGYQSSKFHSVFTDHEVKIQKYKCNTCKTSVTSSVKSLLGTSIHPDLYRLQCEHGADESYRKAEGDLSKMCNNNRSINNHNRIKINTNQVGAVLSEKHTESPSDEAIEDSPSLLVQVDGGHVKTTDPDKNSMEVMTAKIYKPENVIAITETRSEIKERTCAASAKYDKQCTMKKYVKVAAEYQGLSKDTEVTGLADGAKNCWGIIKSLEKHCKSLTCILDIKEFQSMPCI